MKSAFCTTLVLAVATAYDDNGQEPNDWGAHNVYGIPHHEDAYGRPMMPRSAFARFNPYAIHRRANEVQENDWGVHDLYGIRPHEDAYGRPILTAGDVWHPYYTRPEQFRKKLLSQLVEGTYLDGDHDFLPHNLHGQYG